jgi:sugar lactone lactonase YvrE
MSPFTSSASASNSPRRSPISLGAFVALALAGATGLNGQSDYATPYTFTTLAGQAGVSGYVDGTGAAALFEYPEGVAVDGAGNVYVADNLSHIRKITPAGVVTTIPGGAGLGIAVDGSGNLYTCGGPIQMITPAGVVTTIAGGDADSGPSSFQDGPAPIAKFYSPNGIAVDGAGNVYIADSGNYVIRKISNGFVSTIAGLPGTYGAADGTGSAARFSYPTCVAVDASGNVYVGDAGSNCAIRKITPAGVVTTLAGKFGTNGDTDGTGAAALFYPMYGITIDSSGNLYVTSANNTIRKVTSAGVVTTLAGTSNVAGSADGTGAKALFNYPIGIAVDAAGDLFVGDSLNATIRRSYVASSSSPAIVTQPVSQSLAIGASATFSVTATGVPVPTYQWQFNGSDIGGATNPTLVIGSVQAANLGSYTVIVANASGAVTSSAALLSSPGVAPGGPAPMASTANFVDISSRAFVGNGGNVLIAGFVIAGPPGSMEQVLIRGVGPTLAGFGVTGVLSQTALALFDSTGTQIGANTGWSTNPDAAQITSATATINTFQLTSQGDSALLVNLAPGAYTAQVSGISQAQGVALAEVYAVGTGSAQLTNISSRALVGTGPDVEIAGIVVRGSQANVLIRAVGPTLSQFGVSGTLAQPMLSVIDSSGNTVASNTGWSTNPNAAAVASATAAIHTFALPTGSADSALLLTLQPGSYTAVVSGAGGTTGVALVEAYQTP